MELFNVYPLFDIEPIKANGFNVIDKDGIEYLDLYGGHAVISVGHSHPYYVDKLTDQLTKIGFYSNSVQNSIQKRVAEKLGKISGYEDYTLFFTNSGAEANENALKLASFKTDKSRVISFEKGFHGRTSASVAITDNSKIVAPINDCHDRVILPLEDIDKVKAEILKGDVAAVIIEGIQGIAGIVTPSKEFMQELQKLCNENGVIFILDEIQSGYGRSGKFFAHQWADITPDLITVAKGMGNGFPVGGVLISPKFEPWFGMLGTTFGGNHLAAVASEAVLDIIKDESLIENSLKVGTYLISKLGDLQSKHNVIKEIRGSGLMIGIELNIPISDIRKALLFSDKIFTGVTGANTIRLLPPLTITENEVDSFIVAFENRLEELN